MKRNTFLLIFSLIVPLLAWSQVSINNDNSLPDPSAMLDIKSLTRGFLPPCLTEEQMVAIPSPPDGLLVYNLTAKGLYWFDGSAWKNFSLNNFQEADPIFTSHPAFSMNGAKISGWDAAYGWGNHASAGYMTSYAETDPVFSLHPASGITITNINNWNSAYNTRITGASGTVPLSLSIVTNQLTGVVQEAGATTSGYLSSSGWNTFNNKQSPLTFGNMASSDITITGGTGAVIGNGVNLSVMKGNLTSTDMTITGGLGAVTGGGTTLSINKGDLSESTTSVLTITGGTNAVLGSGTTIKVKEASAAQSGYLSSTDWNTFNNKQNALTFGHLTSPDITITNGNSAMKGSGTTLTLDKGNLTSPDFSVAGGTGAVFGSGVNMTISKGNLSESGSSVFIISNGNSALFGNGASIQFRQAGSAQSGYLSSSDWKTFNNKVSSPWASNGSELHYATGNVGIGTSNPASDACLELSSTTAGFLPPSMTRFQRDALQNPAAGLMIICSDCPLPFNFQVYTGTSWLPIPMNRYPVALNVEQSGGPYFQNTISGVYTYQDEDLDAEGATQLQWYRADNSLGINEMPISGATNTTYDLTLADIDKYIRFSVIPAAQTGATPGIEVKSAVFLGPVSSFGCGSSAFNVYHNPAGGVAPILTSFSYNSVTNIPGEDGKCWITRNLGAPVAPNAVNDTRQEVAGWYWQFNRKQGYQHDGSALTPAWNFVPINENSNWLPSNDPCALELDAPWRLPTETEWFNVSSTGDWDDWNGPWNSGLKLHAAGQITSAGFISSRGFTGYYTSSVQYTNTLNYYLVFNDGVCGQSNSNKSNGYTVRCIREN